MIRIFFGFIVLTLLSFGQSTGGFKSYKNQEDYCRDNPKMPTCIKLGPLGNINQVGIYKPPTGPASSGGAAPARQRPQPAEPRTITQVPLQDWRFSHMSPAALINVNIKSLLQSPIWPTLFGAWTGGGSGDVEKARSALSDIGQILISVSPNRTNTPSVLMLMKGNVDGTLASLLKSGMQSKRLDGFTMLVGDSDSLEMASLRMRSPFPRTTSNTLQQTATLEAQKYDVWIGIDPRHIGNMGSVLGGGSNQSLAVLANMRGFSLGLYLRDKIRLEAGLETPSPDIAQRMLAAYQRKEAQQNVWVTAEGSKMQFIAIMEPGQMKGDADFEAAAQMIAPRIGPLLQALSAISPAPQPANPASPPKPGPTTIVINGLDK